MEMQQEEQQRLQQMLLFEEEAYQKGFQSIAGIDEAGRGPLAGPVVACACILPRGRLIAHVNDSKKLTPKMRQRLFEELTADSNILYAVGIIDSQQIDVINIYQATIQAMWQAVHKLAIMPDCLLVDGMTLNHPTIHSTRIVKGDQLSLSIAAASIIAKETRDRLMQAYHERWPQYGFNQHKGYGTAKHLQALETHGPCDIHRLTFDPIKTRWGNSLFPSVSSSV